jgi:hypothetical protein
MQIPRFRCKIFLHLIPEPEEKASELLRDLNANDTPFIPYLFGITRSAYCSPTV